MFGTTYIRQTGGFTGASIIKMPDGWNLHTITEDYRYAISGSMIYKYKESLGTYDRLDIIG